MDFTLLTKKFSVYTVTFIVIFIALAIVTQHTAIFLGLTLGSIFSLASLWSTYFQVKRLGESVEGGRAKFSVGTLFRIGLVLVALYVAYNYPNTFHFLSVVIGFMLTYIIIFINSIFQLKRLR